MKRRVIVSILISILLLLLGSVHSCDQNPTPVLHEKISLIQKNCEPIFAFSRKHYEKKDQALTRLFSETEKIDAIISSKKAKTIEKNTTKFGAFIVHNQDGQNLKITSEIFLKDLNLATTKHEIYFIDPCNIITKMTKYAYRSNRIKSIYYFSYHNQQYVGCIVIHGKSLFHKTDKWFNISDDLIAKNWSKRIYENIIKPHLFDNR